MRKRKIGRVMSIVMAAVVILSVMPVMAETPPVIATMPGTELASSISDKWLSQMDYSNYPWIVSDMTSANSAGVYGNELKKDENGSVELSVISKNFTDQQKQEYVDYALTELEKPDASAGDLSKYIIGLAALGYDASQITTSGMKKLDAMNSLSEKIKTESSIYTLPYALIAFQQYGTKYKSEIDDLINKISDASLDGGGWGYFDSYTTNSWVFDTDATSAVLLSLSPYYNVAGYEKITKAIDDAKLALKSNVVLNDQATITSWGSPSAETTSLLITGLAAVGENPETFFKVDGNDEITDLFHGLMELADFSNKGFKSLDWNSGMYEVNDIATEQGFRALTVASGFSKNGGTYNIYDFSKNSLAPVSATIGEKCVVTFSIIPNSATVEVKNENKVVTPSVSSGVYDLPSGEYTYTAKAQGYSDKSGSFSVSSDEEADRIKKEINISLASTSSATTPSVTKKISVKISVKTHNSTECNNKYTYKNNKSVYYDISSNTISLTSGSSVFDALDKLGITYSEESLGYIDEIASISEMQHGSKSGWMFMVNGKVAETDCRSFKLTSDAEVVWFFSDDYTAEYGSESWSGSSSSSSKPESSEGNTGTITTPENKYDDVSENDWFYPAVKFVSEKGILKGTGGNNYSPDVILERGMAIEILYRLDGSMQVKGESVFNDVKSEDYFYNAVIWAYENKLINGYGNDVFGSSDKITREQFAAILMRYSEYKGYDTSKVNDLALYQDKDDVSGWALDAVKWAVGEGIIKGRTEVTLIPKGNTTRAETAQILMTYMAN